MSTRSESDSRDLVPSGNHGLTPSKSSLVKRGLTLANDIGISHSISAQIKEIASFKDEVGDLQVFLGVCFSPNGNYVLGMSEDLHLFDINLRKEVRSFTGHVCVVNVYDAAISPDGRWILSGDDMYAHLWDLNSGKEVDRFGNVCEGGLENNGPITVKRVGLPAVSVPTNASEQPQQGTDLSQMLKTANLPPGTQYRLHLTPVEGEKPGGHLVVRQPSAPGMPHMKGDGALPYMAIEAVAFSPDGHHAICSGMEDTLLWELETRNEVWRIDTKAHVLAFSGDGRLLVTGGRDWIQVWDVGRRVETQRFSGYETEGWSKNLAFSRDGRRIAFSGEGLVHVLDVESGREVCCFEGHSRYFNPAVPHKQVTDRHIISVAFSPNGQWVLSSSNRATLLWDAESNRELYRFQRGDLESGLGSVAFSTDGRRAAFGAYGIRVFQLSE